MIAIPTSRALAMRRLRQTRELLGFTALVVDRLKRRKKLADRERLA
jgi:hypothetical protein